MLFTKPTNLNGTELKAELSAAGIDVERVTIEIDGQLNIDVPADKFEKAAAVIAKHKGSENFAEPSITEKLASVGLSIDELKAAILA